SGNGPSAATPTRSKPSKRALPLIWAFEGKQLLDGMRVQYSILLDPASLSGRHSIRKIQHVVVTVRVRADDEVHPHLASFTTMDIVQIQPMKIRIHLEAGSVSRLLFHDLIQIERVRFAFS